MRKMNLLMATLFLSSAMTVTTLAGEWNNALGSRQYRKDDQTLATSEWIHHDDAWYHFDSDGYVQTGWFQDAKGIWYFSRHDGVMQTGLIKVNMDVYYLDESGALFEGEKEVYGNIYKFTENGVEGRAPGVLEERTFGINGGQSFSGGSSGGSPSASDSDNAENTHDSGSSGDLEAGLTDGPGRN